MPKAGSKCAVRFSDACLGQTGVRRTGSWLLKPGQVRDRVLVVDRERTVVQLVQGGLDLAAGLVGVTRASSVGRYPKRACGVQAQT